MIGRTRAWVTGGVLCAAVMLSGCAAGSGDNPPGSTPTVTSNSSPSASESSSMGGSTGAATPDADDPDQVALVTFDGGDEPAVVSGPAEIEEGETVTFSGECEGTQVTFDLRTTGDGAETVFTDTVDCADDEYSATMEPGPKGAVEFVVSDAEGVNSGWIQARVAR